MNNRELSQEIKREIKSTSNRMAGCTKRKQRTPEIIETEKGFFLTLRERKIMKLILDEANERVDVNRALSCNRFREAENVCLLIADYVKAYRQGNITQADIERCE